ncbi:hypothetical protein Tco_0224441 [Tanacetum coccineum]
MKLAQLTFELETTKSVLKSRPVVAFTSQTLPTITMILQVPSTFDSSKNKGVFGIGYSLKDKNKAKTDKTEHGNEKSGKSQSRRRVHLKWVNPHPS